MHVLRYTMYHKLLRTGAAVCACVLLFESGVLSDTTRQLSQQTHRYVATAVGMNAAVEPTELNTITAALTEQRLALAEREAAVQEREIAVELMEQGGGSSGQFSTYLIAGLLFILLVLIILNYILDYLHRRFPVTPATGHVEPAQ